MKHITTTSSAGIAIILAAGYGSRSGYGPEKLFLDINGIPILEYTLASILSTVPNLKYICTVIQPAHSIALKKISTHLKTSIPILTTKGGSSRGESMWCALRFLKTKGFLNRSCRWLLTHDGARPTIYRDDIEGLFSLLGIYDGVIIGKKPIFTLRECVQKDNTSTGSTIDRGSLIEVHTPQLFKTDLLLKAYKKAAVYNMLSTLCDDAMALEGTNKKIGVYWTTNPQQKITYPGDKKIIEPMINMSRSISIL